MKILLVCLGNICRSPLAEGLMRKAILDRGLDWVVDSAGTAGHHQGEAPDSRSVAVARENGLDISRQRSRKFLAEDFQNFDHILVMDSSNYNNVLRLAKTEEDKSKVELLLNLSHPGENRQVPDPYYEGGFQGVYDMIELAVMAFVEQKSEL